MTAKELAARLSGRKIMSELSEARLPKQQAQGWLWCMGTLMTLSCSRVLLPMTEGVLMAEQYSSPRKDSCKTDAPSIIPTVPTTRQPEKMPGLSELCGERHRAGAMKRTSHMRSLIFSMTKMETTGKSGAGVLCSVWRM